MEQHLAHPPEDIKLSAATLATILQDAANLDKATVRVLRAAMKFETKAGVENKDTLKETVKVINSICAVQRAKAPAEQQAKLVTANGSAEVQYNSQCLWINGEKEIAQSQHNILVAEAKKNAKL